MPEIRNKIEIDDEAPYDQDKIKNMMSKTSPKASEINTIKFEDS